MTGIRPVMVAPVWHRYAPGWVPVAIGGDPHRARPRPDPSRCARCGRREDDRAHEPPDAGEPVGFGQWARRR